MDGSRIIIATLLIASVIFGPWWLALFFGVYGVWRYRWFFEATAASALGAALYATPGSEWHGIPFALTIASVLGVLLTALAKDRLRWF